MQQITTLYTYIKWTPKKKKKSARTVRNEDENIKVSFLFIIIVIKKLYSSKRKIKFSYK